MSPRDMCIFPSQGATHGCPIQIHQSLLPQLNLIHPLAPKLWTRKAFNNLHHQVTKPQKHQHPSAKSFVCIHTYLSRQTGTKSSAKILCKSKMSIGSTVKT